MEGNSPVCGWQIDKRCPSRVMGPNCGSGPHCRSAGHSGRPASLRVAAHPFCDNFRLTGCRVWPILLPTSLLLHCFASSFCRWARREHGSSKKLPPKPALSAPARDRPSPHICQPAILRNSSQEMSRRNRFGVVEPFLRCHRFFGAQGPSIAAWAADEVRRWVAKSSHRGGLGDKQ